MEADLGYSPTGGFFVRKLLISLFATTLVVTASAQEKEQNRLQEAGTVLQEIVAMPEGLSKDLLDKAECVVVLPSVKKLALGLGGSYGRGAMSCRSGDTFTGPWSAPVLMAVEAGSLGWQIGGQATE
jgi:lipid-binding SYLF domain-containing protein